MITTAAIMARRMSTPAWLMDFTSNAAETFVTAYYAAADSPQRLQLLPSLYLPNSTIAWNGNPISGVTQFAELLDAQPGSQHEIQSFDCHPLGPYNAYGTCGIRPNCRPIRDVYKATPRVAAEGKKNNSALSNKDSLRMRVRT